MFRYMREGEKIDIKFKSLGFLCISMSLTVKCKYVIWLSMEGKGKVHKLDKGGKRKKYTSIKIHTKYFFSSFS